MIKIYSRNIFRSSFQLPSHWMVLLLMVFSTLSLVSSAATITSQTGNINWNATTSWIGGVIPSSTDNVIINGNVTANQTVTCASLTINSGRTLTITSFSFTVEETTIVNGTLTDNNNSGTNIFKGLVTVNLGGVFNNTNSPSYVFRGGITNFGTFALTSNTTVVFSTNSQTIAGSSAVSIANPISIVGDIVVTNENTTSLTLSGLINGTTSGATLKNAENSLLILMNGTGPMMTNGSVDFAAVGNTVRYGTGSAQSIKGATYHHLELNGGSNTKTLGGATTVNGNLTVNTGITFQLANQSLTILGSTTVFGTIQDNNILGTNVFGPITVNNGGSFNTSTANPPIVFRGNIENNGTFTTGSGNITFSTNSLTLSGSNAITLAGIVTVSGAITVTNNSTVGLTINGNLDGNTVSSRFSNAANAIFNYNGTNQPMNTGGLCDFSQTNNTVNYNGANQTIRNGTYFNIGIGGSGIKNVNEINIAGNFTRTNGALLANGTITFNGSTPATYNSANVQTLGNVIISKPGSSLTLTNNGFTTNNLAINNGALIFGTSTARTVSINGDLSGNGEIDMQNAAHILNVSGSSANIGTFTSNSNICIVNYNRAGDQTIFGTPNYKTVNVSGSGTKTLVGNATVNNTLSLTGSSFIALANYDLKLATGANLSGTFSATRMIITNGSGSLIKEVSNASQFTTDIPSGIFPVGTGTFYTPFRINAITASVSATGSISVRAVANRQPNIPYFNNALMKFWSLESINLSSINANLTFSFNSSEVIGAVTAYEPRVWNGSNIVSVNNPSAPGSNPFTSTNTNFITGDWTAIDPAIRTTIYSYQSGDWANPLTWTTDPSGSTSVLPMVPGPGDAVMILNGRTVTTAISRTIGSIVIQGGGVLDMGTTTGNSLGAVSGEGRLRLSSLSFPSGLFGPFTAATGGTVEYYNLPAGINQLSTTQNTYNNLIFSNNTAVSYTAAFNSNTTINGNLNIQRTSSGTSNVLIGNAAASRTISVLGNVTVGTACSLGVGSFNAIHTFSIGGNLTVNGTLNMTNGGANVTPTTGGCNIVFGGLTSNNTASFNAGSSSKFYGLSSNKNDGFELSLTAANGASVLFHNNGAAVRPINGILRLGNNINIPALGETGGGNYDLGTPSNVPVLWIDGATIQTSQSNSIVPYGTLKITSGTLNCTTGASSIVIRESGLIEVLGGTINARMIRTSVTAATHRGAYVQTGGTVNLNASTGNPVNHYAIFSLPYAENVFKLNGGVLNITKTHNCAGGILIGSESNNVDVTDGQVNITVSNSHHFEINSTATFPNLNIVKSVAGGAFEARLQSISWSFDGSPSNNVTVPARPLKVLKNLILQTGSGTTLNANGFDLELGGNFTIQNSATYNSGSNNTIFNGGIDQTYTVNGAITNPGMNHLTIDKTNSTLTLAGSIPSIPANGGLFILSGILNDGGKTLTVAGNITNNSTHIGSGKIVLNGITPQLISGNGNGIFQNLELNNTSGAIGSLAISANHHFRVNGSLVLNSDRVFGIGNRTLTLGEAAVISSINNPFSTNKHIQTSGFLSDGGIVKTFNAIGTMLFPFGTATNNYTPATIQFTQAPAAWGTVSVRPVTSRQLYVTDLNCFEYYWKVNQTGFVGIPANSMNLTFNYGNLADNTAYIPGFYNFQTISYITVNDVNAVNESSKNISFNNWSQLAGDFTAGIPAAFGTVIPYYSRANGNWETPATWSNTTFGGPASGSVPTSNRPVFIGDGNTFNHTVTVTANNAVSGSLVVDAGSTLDVSTFTGHNFGALPYSTAGGPGKIKIASTHNSTARFPAGDFGLFFQNGGGTVEFYSTGSAHYTMPTVTESPTNMNIQSYNNLIISPGSGSEIQMANQDLTIWGNMTVFGHSNGIALLNSSTSRTVNLKNNLSINSGKLSFTNTNNQTLNIDGNVTVASGASWDLKNGGNNLHQLTIKGNIINNGNIDFANNSNVNLTLSGDNNQLLSGTNASALTELFKLNVDKGLNQTPQLTLNVAGTLNTPSNDWLNLLNGTFIFDKGSSITLSDQSDFIFVIPHTAALVVNHNDAVVNMAMANNNNSDIRLLGRLDINAGLVNVGSFSNNTHNDIEYGTTFQPTLNVSGNGVLNVNGQIRRSVFAFLGLLRYSQSGNSTVLVRGKNSEGASSFNLDRAKFEILNEGSQFNMSDNALLIIDRSGLASNFFGDLYLMPSTMNVTGGEVRIGTALTANNANFRITSTVPFWDLSIDGTTSNKIASLANNTLTVQRDLSIYGNSVLNTNGVDVNIGRHLNNFNTTNTAGLNVGGFRAVNIAQTTRFNGLYENQTISGASNNLTNFANVVVQPNSSTATVQLGANSNIRIIGQLNIQKGIFNTAANSATLLGNIVNNQVHTSSGAGTLILQGTQTQIIDGNGAGEFGSVRINNSAGVDMIANSTINGTLNFVNGLVYINNNLLTLGENATITGTLNQGNMIRMNGVTSDAGVRKLYPAAPQDFTFPIGITMKYTPVRMNVSSNTVAGSVTAKPVNAKHPATTDALDKELNYYWSINSTGFNASTIVTHQYKFISNDALDGNINNYVTGRFFSNVWFPVNGMPGTVNPSTELLTLNNVNYFNGDFTAGEPSEFAIIQTYYSRNATLGGNWNNLSSWSTDPVLQHAGAAVSVPPTFNPVVIAEGHTITADQANLSAPVTTVNGTLNLQNFIGHNFGSVAGTGTIRLTPTAGNEFIFPAGNYSNFVNATGGTFEFSSGTTANLPTQSVYNNIRFSGSGQKVLPNTNLLINGNWTIASGTVLNASNKDITILRNWINNNGVNAYGFGTGIVNFAGTNQTITGATTFGYMTISGGGIKELTSSILIHYQLNLQSGIVQTNANEIEIKLTADVTNASNASYVNGNLRKLIASNTSSKSFEIGDQSVYAPLHINFNGSTNGTGSILASTQGVDHPSVFTSGIDPAKSANRHWSLVNTGVTGFSSYNATFEFSNSDLDASTNPLQFGASRFFGSAWSICTVDNATSNSIRATGLTQFGAFQIGQPIDGIIWTGASNTNWNNASNWLPTVIPTQNDNILVGLVTNQPSFTSGTSGSFNNGTFQSGVVVNIPAGYTLNVFGNIVSAANRFTGSGNLVVKGSSASISSDLNLECHLTVDNNASLTAPSGKLEIGRNLTVNGSFIHNSGEVLFSGSNSSEYQGNNIQFNKITIRKISSDEQLALNSNIQVANEINLISGDLNLKNAQLDLGSTGYVSNETVDNRIIGQNGSIRSIQVLNAPNAVNVAGLGAEITSAQNLGSTEIIRSHSQQTYNGGFGVMRTFEIHPTNNNNLGATLKFNYFDDELNTPSGTIAEAELDLWRFDGTFWNMQYATLDMNANQIVKTNIPKFSTWTAGSSTNNALPITLVSFKAACQGDQVEVKWTTASESNNQFFIIEESKDGVNWKTLEIEDGANNSNVMLNYTLTVPSPYPGMYYLRMTQVDYDGKNQTFDPVVVNCEGGGESTVKIAPNPAVDFTNLIVQAEDDMTLDINLFSTSGQIIFKTQVRVRKGTQEINFDVSSIPAGSYHFSLISDKRVEIKGNKTLIKK